MDPTDFAAIGAGMIQDNAVRHLLFVIVALFILIGAVSGIVALGERALGFNTRGAIDELEASAKRHEPVGIAGVALLLAVGILSVTWIAVTVIRP